MLLLLLFSLSLSCSPPVRPSSLSSGGARTVERHGGGRRQAPSAPAGDKEREGSGGRNAQSRTTCGKEARAEEEEGGETQ